MLAPSKVVSAQDPVELWIGSRPSTTAEEGLWLGVLVLAFQDAGRDVSPGEGLSVTARYSYKQLVRDCDEAREFFKSGDVFNISDALGIGRETVQGILRGCSWFCEN